jgi:hypothetical protein
MGFCCTKQPPCSLDIDLILRAETCLLCLLYGADADVSIFRKLLRDTPERPSVG